MKKDYVKPSIDVLNYAQKESVASCGAWITAQLGMGCNSKSYSDDGDAACDPSFPYSAS